MRFRPKPKGKVYLVGAGPGDPGLLTLKARDLIAEADCVIYDYLVNPEILRHASPEAELLYVGKRGFGDSWTQREINDLLLAKVKEHALIVRLKGGDPFVFGRGGEEALLLSEAGIEWEVVPGVTAGSSVAAYAGIPITHRGLSSSVTFVTGHEDPTKPDSAIRWQHLAQGVDTIVFFMGVSRIGEIASQLVEHGRDAETPVAVVSWGTYANQETIVGTLADIGDEVRRQNLKAPALIVVGEVVQLRDKLQWFDKPVDALQFASAGLPNPFFELLAS
ncbi:MAG TPA: uroporphyrinogen-III C-methyltransferase [Blastocatellia bacterium]|nr:uroporphyrinogen-III C-methyltransferase [Blastocatellia bacterium]